MKKARKILAIAAVLAVFSSMNTGMVSASFSESRNTGNAVGYLSNEQEIPDWVPRSANEAVEFRNHYGKTFAEGNIVCAVLDGSSNTAYYAYEIRNNADKDCEVLMDESYQHWNSNFYRVIVYKVLPSENLSFSWIRQTLNRDGSVVNEICEYSLSFEYSEDGSLIETDIYGWLPDSYDEFYDFGKANGNISVHNGYIVFCDEVHQDGGFTIQFSQSGSGKAEEILDYNIGHLLPMESEPVAGDMGREIKVYKPSAPGTVKMTWTESRSWEADSAIKVTEKVFEIGTDLSVREIPEASPSLPNYYSFTFDSPEKMASEIAGNLSKEDMINSIEQKESHKGAFRKFISRANKSGIYVPDIDNGNNTELLYRLISLETCDLYKEPGIYYCFDQNEHRNRYFSYISIMYPDEELLEKTDDTLTIMKMLNPNGADSEEFYPAYTSVTEKEITLADRTVKAVIGKFGETDNRAYIHFLYDDVLVRVAATYNAEENLKSLSFKHIVNTPPAPVFGDANNDGRFNVADLIALKKWISGNYTLKADNSLIDMNSDGIINVFDVCKMRRMLIEMGYDISAVNLMDNIEADDVSGKEADDEFTLSQTQFALSLIQNEVSENKNVLISPYSIMQALAMTANGADGNTKTEMEKVLGGGMDIDELNRYLYTQRTSQPCTDTCKLSTANSIWARDNKDFINVYPEFLRKTAGYFGAAYFKAPFDDTTVNDINRWVKKNTDDMIPEIIKNLTSDDIMCLINAVAFDAKWEEQYNEYSVNDNGKFTAFDGNIQNVQMMNSEEYSYLEDENAKGFLKYYKGRRYAFAALLPNEGVSVTDYISGLTAESLSKTLSEPQRTTVYASLPKFSYDFDTELNETLSEMGMPEAFDRKKADFSKIGNNSFGYNIYISKVIHKTHIEVAEDGTRAGAATAVIMANDSCVMDSKSVILDRPFVFCIADMETHLPVFIGTLMSVN